MNNDKTNSELLIKDASSHLKKITKAAYKITDLFSDHEPLKWRIRNESLAVLSLFLSFANSEPYKRLNYFDKIIFKINGILGLIEVASSGRFITSVNFAVLKREYERIKDFMEGSKFSHSASSELMGLDLGLNGETEKNSFLSEFIPENSMNLKNESDGVKDIKENNVITDNKDKGQYSGILMSFMSDRKTEYVNSDDNAKDIKVKNSLKQTARRSNNGNNKNPKINEDGARKNNLTERGKKIMEIINLKDNKTININEVFHSFSHISKKTIQRELKKLTREGFLKGEGQKRWKTYKSR